MLCRSHSHEILRDVNNQHIFSLVSDFFDAIFHLYCEIFAPNYTTFLRDKGLNSILTIFKLIFGEMFVERD